jgi:hypothetical protein
MQNFKTILTTTAFLLCVVHSLAQSSNLKSKWGVIPPKDLQMTVYDRDSTATSVILQDIGSINVELGGDGYNAYFNQFRRIKIFDESAFEEGNIVIPYYSYRDKQKVTDLDVQVIFPNGEKQKVKSDNVFTEKINKRVSAKKVFIPNLQKGCIIEYKLEIKSDDIFRLFDWSFQEDQPVRYSELTLSYSTAVFDYIILLNNNGTVNTTKDTKMRGQEKIGNTIYTTEYQPALKEEPYITALDDHRINISFQLSGYMNSSGVRESVFEDWGKLAKDLSEDEEFGGQFKAKSRASSDLWDAFFVTSDMRKDSALVIAEKALRFVTSNIVWNQEYRYWLTESVDDAFKKKTGSSGALNLGLLSLLKRSKLEAYPVLLSTIKNGKMFPLYPFTDQFNSVIVLLKDGDKSYLLDATNPYIKLGQLTTQHYNGSGWVADEKNPVWIDFGAHERMDVWLGYLNLSETGEVTGKFSIMADGVEARSWRGDLDTDKAPAAFLKDEFFKQFPDIEIDSVVISDQKNYDKPIKLDFKVKIPAAADVVNDFIYFNPIVHKAYPENPFKAPTRALPVNMIFPFKQDFIVTIAIPEGYTLEDTPKGERTQLANNGGRVSINCSQPTPKTVQVVVKNKLAQVEFAPEEYPALRQFFDALTKNGNTQIVLKKTN